MIQIVAINAVCAFCLIAKNAEGSGRGMRALFALIAEARPSEGGKETLFFDIVFILFIINDRQPFLYAS